MIDFRSFNVRGLNNKCSFVKNFLLSHKLSLFGLLETRVNKDVAKILASDILPNNFRWHFNYDSHPGGRIWVGWNPSVWNLQLLASSSQHITCTIFMHNNPTPFVISFIYGFNTIQERRVLWSDLAGVSQLAGDLPWVACGDFNVIYDIDEASGGNVRWSTGITEFRDCIC